MSKIEKPAPATPGVLTLDNNDLTATQMRKRGGGFGEKIPEFLSAVKEALETGDTKAVILTGDVTKAAANAGNKLRNAAARLTRDLKIATYDDAGKVIGGKIVKVSASVGKHPKHGDLLVWTAKQADVTVNDKPADK